VPYVFAGDKDIQISSSGESSPKKYSCTPAWKKLKVSLKKVLLNNLNALELIVLM